MKFLIDLEMLEALEMLLVSAVKKAAISEGPVHSCDGVCCPRCLASLHLVSLGDTRNCGPAFSAAI